MNKSEEKCLCKNWKRLQSSVTLVLKVTLLTYTIFFSFDKANMLVEKDNWLPKWCPLARQLSKI